MSTRQPKRILVAPLDWGLGHTTRCIPLIACMLRQQQVPVFAGNEQQRKYIEETCSGIETIHLDGYDVQYSRLNRVAQLGLMLQMPGILRRINAEHEWLGNVVHKLGINGIISDNRYGLHHPDIPNVLITHQLRVQTGMGHMADNMVQRLHYRYLRSFNTIWIPDTLQAPGLGNELSHSTPPGQDTQYIGLLSRFAVEQSADGNSLLVLLSGPEPQRTALSDLLWLQVCKLNMPVIFVEGSSLAQRSHIPGHIIWHQRLTHTHLALLLQRASMIVCRSGYSTLMDLAALRKKAILIPTPGQTEQEYLARTLHQEGIWPMARQNGFNLLQELEKARSFPYCSIAATSDFEQYEPVLNSWLQRL